MNFQSSNAALAPVLKHAYNAMLALAASPLSLLSHSIRSESDPAYPPLYRNRNPSTKKRTTRELRVDLPPFHQNA